MQNPRADFLLLEKKVDGGPIVYLDSAATSLKPQTVIDAVNEYYREYTANVFRGIYKFSEKATARYEEARMKIASFVNAASRKEIIFVRNATEAINLVAYAWGRLNIDKGDEIVTTIMEHHSNFVPWQRLCVENGATLKVIDITGADGYLDVLDRKLKVKSRKLKVAIQNSKLLVITHVSNVLGTINPIREIVRAAKKINPEILVLVDGAQAISHLKVDVQDLGCDFYAFSGHKMLGPTGVGVLWGSEDVLEQMAPFNFGGEMINEVYLNRVKFKRSPHKFEAGTPHIAGVIGLGAAVDYLSNLGMDTVRKHEIEITKYALERLGKLENIAIYGPPAVEQRGGVVAFNLFDTEAKIIHPHDVAQILDEDNIFVRAGHHCAMPLHTRLAIPASVRATFYIYNTKQDVDMLAKGLEKVVEKLGQA